MSFERGRLYSSVIPTTSSWRQQTGDTNLHVSPSSTNPRPSSAEGRSATNAIKAMGKNHPSPTLPQNKTGLQKITKMFRKEQKKGEKPRVAPGFFDEQQQQAGSAGSPDSSPKAFRRIRSYSVGSRTALKVKRGKDREEPFFMWKPVKRKRCEWESISGRQLTIKDIHVSELSKVELEALQQMAIARLQELDISVSKSSIRSGKLKIVKRKGSNERIVNSNAVFGQPLTTVLNQDKTRTVTSPVHTTAPAALSTSVSSASPPPPLSSTLTFHPEQPIASPGSEPDTPTPTDKSVNHQGLLRRESIVPIVPQVPFLVRKTIDHLDTNGIKTEGLFRVPGAKARIDMIKQKFDNGEDVELTEDTSPHDVACVFKEFFRSLPEPLMTRELYYPLLKTRKLATRAQQKDALRYLVLLLPRPNRDTLQELLQFLCRVALHSNGIILIDGTEESGNRMTEDNLATVLGPNIIHNESRSKSPQSNYSVMKQDPEELSFVCQVMADLIKMQDAIYTIPAELYDAALQHLFLFDHEAVDAIMRIKCIAMENKQDELDMADNNNLTVPTDNSDMPRSQSSHYFEDSSIPRSSTLPSNTHGHSWHRSHSFNDAERSLDDVMRDLQEMLSEGLSVGHGHHRRHSSNDSAMGESECVTSPLQNPQVSHAHRDDPSMYNSVDSAISNHSPHHSPSHSPHHSSSSEEGCARVEWLDEVDSAFATFPAHIHTSSGISVHSDSPAPSSVSPLRFYSPKLPKGELISSELAGSLPVLTPGEASPSHTLLNRRSSSPFSISKKKFRKSTNSVNSQDSSRGSRKDINRSGKKKKQLNGSLDDNMPVYNPQRSPLLGHRQVMKQTETPPTDFIDATPTTFTNTTPASVEVLQNMTPRFHYMIQTPTEVLI